MDIRKDPDFLSASDADQHAYLMSSDQGYAAASPQDQSAYRASLKPDVVGQAKAFLTKTPDQPRPDILEMLTGKKSTDLMDLGPAVRAAGKFMLPDSKSALARDVAMSAVPISRLAAPGSRFIAPAVERTAYAAAQPLAEKGLNAEGAKASTEAGLSTATLEALMGALSLGRAARTFGNNWRAGQPQVHQDVNFNRPPGNVGPIAPVDVQRVVPGGNVPTVYGGGGSYVSPTQVRVVPPRNGYPASFGGSTNADVRVSEPISRARQRTEPIVPDFLRRTIAIEGGAENPEVGLTAGAKASEGGGNLLRLLLHLTPHGM